MKSPAMAGVEAVGGQTSAEEVPQQPSSPSQTEEAGSAPATTVMEASKEKERGQEQFTEERDKEKAEEKVKERVDKKAVEAPAAKTGPMHFLDLAKEMQMEIISHITRPTDLKSLCLVCHHLHQLTIQKLYREVTLEVGSPTDTKLTAFINPRNKGVKHIKKMDLYLADQLDKCNQLQQAHFAVRMLLEFLPENILEKFSWHPWSPFSSDNLKILYRTQRNMKWLEGISLDDANILPVLTAQPSFPRFFQNVRKLGLYPDSREVLNFCAMLVKNTRDPLKITLHASFDEETERNGISMRELNDSSTAPGLLTSTIFGHLMPFDKCKPMHLQEFTLQKINLRYAASTYCQFIDFRGVKALRVFGCSGADSLFAELSKSQKLPEKLETLEFKHEDNPENDALNALDGFLCLVSGIKVLTLDVCYAKALPSSAGIVRHGRTLRELNVHGSRGDGEEEELVYDFDDFEKICKGCPGIEQLSAAFPATSLIRPNTDSFQAFENALADLQKLVTLNITTWPTNTPSTSRLPRKTYEVLLQSLAQSIFMRSVPHPTIPPQYSWSETSPSQLIATQAVTPTTVSSVPTSPSITSPLTMIPSISSVSSTSSRALRLSPRLTTLAFGSSDKVYDREDSKNQIIYVKGRQIDPFGAEKPLAVQVGWCLRKYVEGRSDVLDFSLARSCRPPTREVPVSEDSD